MERHPYLRLGLASVLAHRGASEQHPPGNTWEAFDAAVTAGSDHFELDVQVSADGELVIFHDDSLDEITTGRGSIGEQRWSELEAVRYLVEGRASDQGLVRFADLLVRYPQAFINVDAKTDSTVEPLAEMLRQTGKPHQFCVAAFSLRRIVRLRRLLGNGWCTALSKPEIVALRVASWLRLPVPKTGDVAQVPCRTRRIPVADKLFLRAAHRSGIAVHVWTVNDPNAIARLLGAGFDAVITDRPDKAVRLARQHR